jgi:hypothetical protein
MVDPTITPGSAPEPIRILMIEDNAGDVYLVEKALQQRRTIYTRSKMARRKSPSKGLGFLKQF